MNEHVPLLVVVGYMLVVGLTIYAANLALERRDRRSAQVRLVRDRLAQATLPSPVYETIVRLNSNGMQAKFRTREALPLGCCVSFDATGNIGHLLGGTPAQGIVVAQRRLDA